MFFTAYQILKWKLLPIMQSKSFHYHHTNISQTYMYLIDIVCIRKHKYDTKISFKNLAKLKSKNPKCEVLNSQAPELASKLK